jgi:hypothetical protein
MQQINTNTIKKGVRIFLDITVAVITVILIFTVTKETLTSLKKMRLMYFLLALVVSLLFIYFEILRLQTLTWSLGKWISTRASIDFTLGGAFLTIIPFGVAGVPLQLYILNKEGIEFGKGGAILIVRGALVSCLLPFIIPFILANQSGLFQGGLVAHLTRYLVIAVGVGIIILLLAIFRTDRTKVFLYRFIKKEKARSVVNRILKEVQNMKSAFGEFAINGKWKLLLSFFLTGVSRGFYFFLPYPILRGLGLHPPLGQTTVIQIILSYLLVFSPTPGASGIAETGGMGLFSLVCPRHLIGIFVILWRFFSYYLSVIIGGFIILRLISKTS